MQLLLCLAQTVTEDVEIGGGGWGAHDINCSVLRKVLICHVQPILFLSRFKGDVRLPELTLDLTVHLIRLLLQILKACLVHNLLDWLDLASRRLPTRVDLRTL